MKFNPVLLIAHIVCVIILSYTLVIKNIFASNDTVNTHLRQSGLYADIANLLKAQISTSLSERLNDRIVLLALSERLVDAIVTPQFVEKRSQRILPLTSKIIDKPLDIKNEKVVIDTKSYKQRITSELENRDIPEVIAPTVQNIVTSVPDQLQLVDMEKRPNSILEFLTKAKILYENVTLWNTIALISGIITGVLLILFNRKNLQRLFKYLSMAYLISGAVVLVGSFLFPYVLTLFNQGPNSYLNKMVSDALYYFFELTRTPSVVLLLLGAVLSALFRWFDPIQLQLYKLLGRSIPANKKTVRDHK